MEIYSDSLVIFRNNISVWPKYVDRKANILFLQSRDVLCFTLIRALYCAQSRDICTVCTVLLLTQLEKVDFYPYRELRKDDTFRVI